MTPQPATPPETLYFAATREGATAILASGLVPEAGAQVRLAANPGLARQTGGTAVFTVYARTAHDEGQAFWQAGDGTWLTGPVDPEFMYLPPIRGAE